MNRDRFTYLLNKPQKSSAENSAELSVILEAFPYFQSARALQLKILRNSDSYLYNQALKKTAAHTTDRRVLFEFITSTGFDKGIHLEKGGAVSAESVTIQELHQKIVETLPGQQSPEKDNTAAQDTAAAREQAAAAADTLSLGSPISFKSSEQHSFNEWMQLISIKPLSRGKISEETSPKRKDTLDLIEKFIAKKPRIQAPDKHRINEDISKQSIAENDHLMTETLARVYLEQKKYDKAVNAYRILSLKYPEKSGFFADRIKAIKILQKNNKS